MYVLDDVGGSGGGRACGYTSTHGIQEHGEKCMVFLCVPSNLIKHTYLYYHSL